MQKLFVATMSISQTILLIILGLLSGFINMFAGGGSMLVVPFLILIGLPANVANATNRVAIICQNLVSTATFRKKKIINFKYDYKLLIPTAAGSILGAYAAVDIRTELLEQVIGFLLVIMFFMVLLEPQRWIKPQTDNNTKQNKILSYFLFFLIGLYGGFIQIGVGFFLLAGLVLNCKYDLLKANGLKVFIILFYNIIALLIFMNNDLIHWKTGLILSVGNMTGAWIGARLSIKWGPKFIRYFLLAALIMVALKLLKIY